MNNVLQLRYAVEVEKTGSISRAAENLYMGQPHLSKAIRDLEYSVGLDIFHRTSKGVEPTAKGKEFLSYAKSILRQIDEMEAMYKTSGRRKQEFDICVPRASYISHAFTKFVMSLDSKKEIKINYRETNSMNTIKNVADGTNSLGVVRYQSDYEDYYQSAFTGCGLQHKLIMEFEHLALMSQLHPLADSEIISFEKLKNFTEIVHGDLSVPALPIAEAKKIVRGSERKKQISIYERGSQFELLSSVTHTYMWVSPMPDSVLQRFELTEKRCDMSKNKYKDSLIYRKGYHFTEADERFIQMLNRTADAAKAYTQQ